MAKSIDTDGQSAIAIARLAGELPVRDRLDDEDDRRRKSDADEESEDAPASFPAMRAWVRVVSQDEYEQYVADLAENLAAAQEEVARQAAAEAEAEASAITEAAE